MAGSTDVRDALRSLRLRPGWAGAAVVTLALGIGANATMFALVDRLLVRPPPHIRDPRRVVRFSLEFANPGGSGGRFAMATTSYPVFSTLARSTRSFASLAAVAPGAMVLGTGADARSISVAKVSGSYFRLLGTTPIAGRFFAEPEDEPPAGQAVAVISYALWRREFDLKRSAPLGAIRLDGAPYQVIGVAPADFTGDDVEPVDVWVPINAAMGTGDWREQRNVRLLRILGRLRDGVSRTAAAAEGSLALRRGLEGFGGDDPSARVVLGSVMPGWSAGREASVQGRVALWVAAMSVVVLLIAVVNVTNLLLLRGAARRREMAVRLAIGASVQDLVRAPILESLILASLGGVAALAVAAWGSEAVRATLLPTLAASDALLSPRLVAITFGGTLVAGIVTGLVPAWRAARTSPVQDLKLGGGVVGRSRSVTPNALIVAQGSLCMVLLVSAALFVLSLHRVRTQDFGFQSRGVLLAELRFAGSLSGPARDAVYRQADAEIQRLPGIELTSLVQAVPFLGHNVPPIAVPGREDFPDVTQQAPFLTAATPSYFRVLDMTLRAGRNFTEADRAGSPLVVIINQAMAGGLWPGESPLGRCIQVGFVPGEMPSGIHASPTLPCREVIGVVNNARPRSIREEAGQARMQYYIPFGQLPVTPFEAHPPAIWGLLLRTGDAGAMAPPVQRALQSFTSEVPLADVRPLEDVLERQMRPWLLGATLFSVFGLLALGLAAIGLYGVRAYAVAQRTQEIGIRMALGAGMRSVMGMILRDGLRIAGAGIVVGAVVALALSRLLEPLLFETRATDLRVYALVGCVLVGVAIAASAVPAWRAARVDPNVALRAE